MKILHLTDIHGKKSLIQKISEDLKVADLVLISGDITHFGRSSETEQVVNEIQKLNKSIYAIPGNCDYPEVNQFLAKHSMSLDRETASVNNFLLMGMGGSLPCPGTTPNEYPEEKFRFELNKLFESLHFDSEMLILLIHQPPCNTKNDRVMPGLHVGSNAVREFIEERQPLLVLSGHIHEGRGVDEIGKTKIINPGAFREGYYTIIDILDTEVSIELKKV